MTLRKITEKDVLFTLSAEVDDAEVDGHFATDDAEADAKMVADIKERLRNGEVWAWACVTMTANWEGCLTASTSLGCCSYENEEDFKKDDYFPDMKQELLDDLNKQAEGMFKLLKTLEGPVEKLVNGAKKLKPVYLAEDLHPDSAKLRALKKFITESVVDASHKKLVKKFRIAEWDHKAQMYIITPEAKTHAQKLGYL
jgi:hypothetical protein